MSKLNFYPVDLVEALRRAAVPSPKTPESDLTLFLGDGVRYNGEYDPAHPGAFAAAVAGFTKRERVTKPGKSNRDLVFLHPDMERLALGR